MRLILNGFSVNFKSSSTHLSCLTLRLHLAG
jgi:hypothetical protein